jgi:microcystin-dependent protein
MSCNCTGNCDLVSINPLVLSDTFHTWYDRTNEIIAAVNPIQVYDVNVGATDGGLTAQTTCVGGNSNGMLTLKVWTGPGIGVGTTVTPDYYLNHTMIDVSNMTIMGLTGYDDATITNRPSRAFPNGNDWFIVSDTLDSSLGSGAGTPKRVQANHMLPQTVYLPSGFQFNGNVSINGNLSIQGTQSNIDSNDLRIEDKLIELAYHRLVSIDVTGPTYGNAFAAPGVTFYYYDPGVGNTGAYTTVGQISSVTSLGSGKTNLKLHKFVDGGVADIVAGGRLSITGQFFDFTINAGPTTTNSFYDDDTLSEAGILVHGVTSDKDFVWVYKRGNDVYNAFVTTTNLGVSGPNNAIISSKFLSFGYGATNGVGINNTFTFQGFTGAAPTIRLGGLGTGGDQYGYWGIQRQNYGGTGTQQPLVFSFKQHSATGENTSFTIWSGASGPTYGGTTSAAGFVTVANQGTNRVGNFAQGLNVDLLDGAHGTTLSTAWSIPIALSTGKIDSNWFDSQSIGKCYTITGHGFNVGDAVRLNGDNGSMTGAIATSTQNAEVLGIVSSVADANNFCIVSEGFVYNLSGGAGTNIYNILPLVTGNAYFLSADNQGALIADPDTGAHALEFGEVRKPMMIAMSSNSGYVQNFLGVVEGVKTDIIDVQGLNPVGMIMPFSGTLDTIPYGWLVCDGSRLETALFPELYGSIGQSYYAEATLSPSYNPFFGGDVPLLFTGGNKGLKALDAVRVVGTKNGSDYSIDTYVVSVNSATVTVKAFDTTQFDTANYDVYGRINTASSTQGGVVFNPYTSVFFLPDMRSRTLVGATRGLTGNLDLDIGVGDLGGTNKLYLDELNIPPHAHSLNTENGGTLTDNIGGGGFANPYIPPFGVASQPIFTSLGPVTTEDQTPIDNMPAYVTIHWIIRAKKGLTAMILSGHNHDDRYIRYDAAHTGLTVLNRSTFQNNAKVLSNGYDGDDVFHGKLTITGGAVIGDNGRSLLEVKSGASFGGGATFSGGFAVSRSTGIVEVSSGLAGYLRLNVQGPNFVPSSGTIADLLIENGTTSGSWNSIAGTVLPTQASLKIRGGSQERATIAIFNDNANSYGGAGPLNADTMMVEFYGHGEIGSTIKPKFAGSLYGGISGVGSSTYVSTVGLQIGITGSVRGNVLEFSQIAKNGASTVVTTLPQSLPTATTAEATNANTVILTSTNELKKVNGGGFGPKFINAVSVVNLHSPGRSLSRQKIDMDARGLGTSVIPVTATALILETHVQQSGPDSNGMSTILASAYDGDFVDGSGLGTFNNTTPPDVYKIGGNRASGGGDNTMNVCQAIIPFDTEARAFYWMLSYPIIGNIEIRVVGYF